MQPAIPIRSLTSRRQHALALMVMLAVSGASAAAPQLHCQVSQGGDTWNLAFAPEADPYLVKAVDINGNFRFKAAVIGDGGRIDYVKIYTYYQTRRQAVLLHAARYPAPAVAPAGASPTALTGLQYVYSPRLGRELQYGCALVEAGR
ncbi:MAG: hypothetical protein HGA47_14550 [Zoogloea sp.]|nr:hypothetical protein [Zoogloea sp.]